LDSKSNPACESPYLNVLVQRVQFAVRRADPESVAERVGAVLQPFLGNPDLLLPSQCEPDPERYRQHVLYVAEDGSFSIVALVWLPGQSTPVHDHISWCVVGVHQGQELGIQYSMAEVEGVNCLLPAGLSRNGVGTVEALTPPGDIHCVINPGPGLAISLHVYGADVRKLGSSIRRRYETGIQPAEPARIVARAS
jgi:predicted metal-dependent enzyme (double-stranded beta helix superfamily)